MHLLELYSQRQLLEDREEHVRKLKLELEERYQETLKAEKQSWLKAQAAGATQVEHEVMLGQPAGSLQGRGCVSLFWSLFNFPAVSGLELAL